MLLMLSCLALLNRAGGQMSESCDGLLPYPDTLVEPAEDVEIEPWWLWFERLHWWLPRMENSVGWAGTGVGYHEEFSETPSTIQVHMSGQLRIARLVQHAYLNVYSCVYQIEVAGTPLPTPTPVADPDSVPDAQFFGVPEDQDRGGYAFVTWDGSVTEFVRARISNVGTGDLIVYRIFQPVTTDRIRVTIKGPTENIVIPPGRHHDVYFDLEILDYDLLRVNRILGFPITAWTNDPEPTPFSERVSHLTTWPARFEYFDTADDIPDYYRAPPPTAEGIVAY